MLWLSRRRSVCYGIWNRVGTKNSTSSGIINVIELDSKADGYQLPTYLKRLSFRSYVKRYPWRSKSAWAHSTGE
jgi:hypothetical protein